MNHIQSQTGFRTRRSPPCDYSGACEWRTAPVGHWLKQARQITHLFSVHLAARQLMSRELVEKLYNLVRSVGYLACPEMTRYLNFLESKEKSFSPGERFVHRRLQGLVKLCS